MESGYGIGTLLRAARGGGGKDTVHDWDDQEMAREYFLRCYAFPRWASLILLPLVFGSVACFAGMLITWNPRSPFLAGELFFTSFLALAAMLPLREPRRGYLRELLADNPSLRKTLKDANLVHPLWLLDVATLRPSWISLGFLLTALAGGVLVYSPVVAQEASIPVNISIWGLEVANFFSLPIFFGFTLIGIFPWPTGVVEDRLYYPLLVLRRAVLD